jgi:hypothetical protein
VGSSSGPLTVGSSPRRHGGHRVVGEDLRVDGLGGLAVLGGEPVIGQVQVDPGGLDRGVPGLGLDRLQCHPSLPESGQTGVPQLMAGPVGDARAAAGAIEHLVQSCWRQRLPAAWSFEHHEQLVGAGIDWALGVEVGGDVVEEPSRDRHQALVAALAVGDEHPPLGHPEVTQPQTDDFAAAQAAQHHRGDHRPVPVRAQDTGQRVDLGRGQDPRQRPGPTNQRNALVRSLSLDAGR